MENRIESAADSIGAPFFVSQHLARMDELPRLMVMTLFASTAGKIADNSREISEMDVLWMTAGLGCDGDTIAVTGATQPSIEDLVLGAFPWIPKIKFHNPFLAYENGEDFVRFFREAAEGRRSPFILVVE